MNKRRRTLPPVSPKTPQELRPLVAAMAEIIETGEGVRGNPLDRKVTFRDLLDSGIGKLRPGTGPGSPGGLEPGIDDPAPDLSIPPAPEGFTADGSFYGMINLSWTDPATLYLNHAYTNIYRSEEDNFANAEVIGRDIGGFYTDFVRQDAVDPDDPTLLKGYYYWITFVSIADIEGPPNDTAGTFARPIADVGYVIELLTGEIDAGLLAQSLKEEIDKIQPLEDVVEGPESVAGTVAHRIATSVEEESQARIDALEEERAQRIDAVEGEALARAQAIAQESDDRAAAIDEEAAIREEEDTFSAALNRVLSANAGTQHASINALEEVRVTESETFASQIDQIYAQTDDNYALILEEKTVRTNETSALASQVGILSARLDARPTLSSGFEPGADFDAWTGSALAADTSDPYAGTQAGLITSSTASASLATDGVRRTLDAELTDEFSGAEIRIGFYAKQPDSGASTEAAVGYTVGGAGDSGWLTFAPEVEWTYHAVTYVVPAGTASATHELAFWGDTSGSGGGVLIDRVTVTLAEVQIPEVAAAIESIQQAQVDFEEAVAQDLTGFEAQLDSNTATIQQEITTRTTLTDALASDVTALQAETDANAAAIVSEREAWSSATDALAEDVQTLTASVGDNTAAIQEEAAARANEDEFSAAVRRVLSATTGTKAATVYSLEEVRQDANAATAEVIEGLQTRFENSTATIETKLSLLSTADQALAEQVNVVRADLEGDVASVTNTVATEVSRLDGRIDATASDVTTVQSQIDDDIAGVEQTLSTEISRVDGELEAIGALYTVNVQSNGLVGGFGIYNDGTSVEAGFDVDRFWIGRTNSDKRKPFIVEDGVVYMDDVMIRQGAIQEGQLGPITIGKLFFDDGAPVTTVGGLIRADAIDAQNLSVGEAATFTGVAQSTNYDPGSYGWIIRPNGTVEFNEGTFNGTVEFRNVTGGPPADADRTADNTSRDTQRVDGEWASSVRNKANRGDDAKSRTDYWTKPNKTTIDGNKITTGEAYVDTLEIKGQAVTFPVSSSGDGNYEFDSSYNWIDVRQITNYPSKGNPILVFLSVRCGVSAWDGDSASIKIRLLEDGAVISEYTAFTANSRVTGYTSDNAPQPIYSGEASSGFSTAILQREPRAGNVTYRLEAYTTADGTDSSAFVDEKSLSVVELKR